MGVAAGLGALGMDAFDMFGGNNAQNVQLTAPFSQTPGSNQAIGGILGGVGNLGQFNLYQPNLGQASNITQGLVNNPYAGGAQGAANIGGALGQAGALNQFGAGGQLGALGNYVGQLGVDPQQQLYNYLQNQNMQQAQVANAQAGVANTPYGAGVVDQSNQLFNMNWQNQLLNRATQGLGADIGAQQAASGLQGQGAQQYAQAGALPYQTYGQIGQGQIGALGQLGQFGSQGQVVAQTPIQDYLSYLQAGTGAQQAATGQLNAQVGQQNIGWGQNYQNLGLIGGGLAGLGNTPLGQYGLSSTMQGNNPFFNAIGNAIIPGNWGGGW